MHAHIHYSGHSQKNGNGGMRIDSGMSGLGFDDPSLMNGIDALMEVPSDSLVDSVDLSAAPIEISTASLRDAAEELKNLGRVLSDIISLTSTSDIYIFDVYVMQHYIFRPLLLRPSLLSGRYYARPHNQAILLSNLRTGILEFRQHS